MSNFQRSTIGTALILIICFCSVFVVSRCTSGWGRVDFTAEGLYTLTDGTKAIIDDLQKPRTIKLFYSKDLIDNLGRDDLKAFNNLYYYVRDVVYAYESYGDGRIVVQEYDPIAFSEAEAEAQRLGVRGLPTGQPDVNFFFGLAVTSDSGAEHAIEYFGVVQPNEIEYRISEAIELTSRRKKSGLGVLSSLDITGGQMTDFMRQMMRQQGRPVQEPWAVMDYIKQFYDISDIAADATEIAPELDYLMVIHPKGLGDGTLYAIDQFVMRGGKLIVFVDPFARFADPAPQDQQNPMAGMSHDNSSNLNRLLEAWGAKVDPAKFVGDEALMQQMRTGFEVGFLALNTDPGVGVNGDEIVTKGLGERLFVYFGGAVERVDVESKVDFVPLLTTTATGNTIKAEKYQLNGPQGPDAAGLLDAYVPGTGPVTLAARLTGTLKSAFPDGKPKSATDGDNGDGTDPAKPDEVDPTNPDVDPETDQPADSATDPATDPANPTPEADPHRAETSVSNTVIVFGDVDMMADGVAMQRVMGSMLAKICGNPDLIMNTLDYLAGSNALMSVRSGATVVRRFDAVEAIEREADAKTRAQVKAINDEIQRYQSELNDIRSQANEANVGLLQNEAIIKKREIEAHIREKQRELNDVQKDKNDAIRGLGTMLRFVNIGLVPGLVLLIGLGVWLMKKLGATGGAA